MSPKTCLRAGAALLAIAAAPAWAAEQQEPPAAQDQDVGATSGDQGVEEIIVTANRRVENMQQVPISIAAFTGQTLKAQGVVNVVDLPQLTPGLGFSRTLVGTNAFLRGVGTTSAGYSTESPIATYIDGLYLPNSAASSFSFNNVERIEILKGPQGTLYGRNTTGGLIHVITKEPGDVASADMSVSFANYDTVQANFYGSTPITDTLAVNFAALYIDQGDGWGRNIFLDTPSYKFHDVGFQGKLRWKPGPDTTITLRGFYDKVKTDQGNNTGVYPGSIATDGTPYSGRYVTHTRIEPFATQRQYSVSLKAEHGFDFATLTSTTGYINNKSLSAQIQNGIVGLPNPLYSEIFLGGDQAAKTFSQELQLASNRPGSDLQWIVGAFYYNDKTTIQADVHGTCVGTTCANIPQLLPSRTTGIQRTKSYSAYAEGTYSITPSTRITLGLRYTSDNKTLDGTLVPLAGRPNSIPAFPPSVITSPNGVIDTDVTFGKLTWKAVLAQDFTPDIHGYVSYNRGFKSGGYNPISFANPPSRPEVLDSYEVGIKSELFDRRLRFNVSGFYYDYKDIQLRSTAPPAPPGGSLLFNAASARIKGIDADFVIAPVQGLTINGGFQLLDAKYHRFPAGVCTTPRVITPPFLGGTVSSTCNLSGFRLPQAPEFSYSLGVTYRFDTPIGNFEANVNDGYKSSFVWEPDNRLKQGAYHLINASLTWTEPSGRMSVQGFVRNLGGEYYFVSAANGGGNDAYVPGAPRTYGMKLRYQF